MTIDMVAEPQHCLAFGDHDNNCSSSSSRRANFPMLVSPVLLMPASALLLAILFSHAATNVAAQKYAAHDYTQHRIRR